MNSRILYENLDTSFVNLWALLRYLIQRGIIGRVHVQLEDYTADVFLTGSSTPMVHEIDHATGRESLEEAALHRLVVRAREPGGAITVYEGADEAQTAVSNTPMTLTSEAAPPSAPPYVPNAPVAPITPINLPAEPPAPDLASPGSRILAAFARESAQKGVGDWADLVEISGELIAAVERAATGVGADFASIFKTVRLELADDYTFLDPSMNRFDYANSSVKMTAKPGAGPYVAAISESLRRVVDKIANGDRAGRIRERVALDLAMLARKRREALTRFNLDMQLDRIAGTRVL
ncbi:MAG TPA: hypothetical protein VGJ55_07430 [Pyrinomonadaceae bacterium]